MKEKKKKKEIIHTPDSLGSSDLNAALDSIIIELLKKHPKGLCQNEIREIVKKNSELGKKDYRTRIGTRLEYLSAFGQRTGLFEIRSEINKEKKRYFDISTKCLMPKYS